MLEKEFEEVLTQTSALRKHRQEAADMILNNPELFLHLLKLSFGITKEISYRACWVFEFVYKAKPEWLIPHLDLFFENAPKVKYDQAIRPISKICQLLVEAYFSKKASKTKDAITNQKRVRSIALDVAR